MRPMKLMYKDESGKHRVTVNPINGEIRFSDIESNQKMPKNVTDPSLGKITTKDGDSFSIVKKGDNYYVDSAELGWLVASIEL